MANRVLFMIVSATCYQLPLNCCRLNVKFIIVWFPGSFPASSCSCLVLAGACSWQDGDWRLIRKSVHADE